MAGTFQNLSGGRLLLNVVTGGESHEQRMYGDFLDKDARYARCDEFLHVVRGALARRDRRVPGRAPPASRPPCSTRSPTRARRSTSAARRRPLAVAARHADVYLTWGEPPEAVQEKIDWIRKLAAEQGREVRFGIRMHTITRDTSEEAWAEADRLLAGIDPAAIEKVQAGLRRSESEGQRRMLDLNGGTRTTWRSTPTSGPAWAWSAAAPGRRWWEATSEVADRIEEYAALGIDEFILSGYPHLEGAYWFGEGVLPILAERGRWEHPAPVASYNAVGAVRGPWRQR